MYITTMRRRLSVIEKKEKLEEKTSLIFFNAVRLFYIPPVAKSFRSF